MRTFNVQRVTFDANKQPVFDTLFSSWAYATTLEEFQRCVEHYGDAILVMHVIDGAEHHNLLCWVPQIEKTLESDTMRRLKAEHRLFAMVRNNEGWVKELARMEIEHHVL